MEQNSRLKPATKHVIRCAAALACPKMAPTFRAVDNALTLFRVWPMRFQRYFYRPPFFGTFARKAPCCCAWYRGQGFRLFAFPANHERRQLWNTTVNR